MCTLRMCVDGLPYTEWHLDSTTGSIVLDHPLPDGKHRVTFSATWDVSVPLILVNEHHGLTYGADQDDATVPASLPWPEDWLDETEPRDA